MAAAYAAMAAGSGPPVSAPLPPYQFMFPHHENPALAAVSLMGMGPPLTHQIVPPPHVAPPPRPPPSSEPSEKKQSRYWTDEEHQRFLIAWNTHGPKNYGQIAEYVGTRNAKQVRTHAQKFQKKLEREEEKQKNDACPHLDPSENSIEAAAAAAVRAAAADAMHGNVPGIMSVHPHGAIQIMTTQNSTSSDKRAKSSEGSSSTNNVSSERNGDSSDLAHLNSAAAAAAAAVAVEAAALGRGSLPVLIAGTALPKLDPTKKKSVASSSRVAPVKDAPKQKQKADSQTASSQRIEGATKPQKAIVIAAVQSKALSPTGAAKRLKPSGTGVQLVPIKPAGGTEKRLAPNGTATPVAVPVAKVQSNSPQGAKQAAVTISKRPAPAPPPQPATTANASSASVTEKKGTPPKATSNGRGPERKAAPIHRASAVPIAPLPTSQPIRIAAAPPSTPAEFGAFVTPVGTVIKSISTGDRAVTKPTVTIVRKLVKQEPVPVLQNRGGKAAGTRETVAPRVVTKAVAPNTKASNAKVLNGTKSVSPAKVAAQAKTVSVNKAATPQAVANAQGPKAAIVKASTNGTVVQTGIVKVKSSSIAIAASTAPGNAKTVALAASSSPAACEKEAAQTAPTSTVSNGQATGKASATVAKAKPIQDVDVDTRPDTVPKANGSHKVPESNGSQEKPKNDKSDKAVEEKAQGPSQVTEVVAKPASIPSKADEAPESMVVDSTAENPELKVTPTAAAKKTPSETQVANGKTKGEVIEIERGERSKVSLVENGVEKQGGVKDGPPSENGNVEKMDGVETKADGGNERKRRLQEKEESVGKRARVDGEGRKDDDRMEV